MTDGEVAAAMEVARAAGFRVAAHCRSAESVLLGLRHGVEVIYHANYADERALDALEAAKDHVFVGPALGITYNLSQAVGQWGITPDRARFFEHELEATVEVMRRRGSAASACSPAATTASRSPRTAPTRATSGCS